VRRLTASRQLDTGSKAVNSAGPATGNSDKAAQNVVLAKQQDMAAKLAMQALLRTLHPCPVSSVCGASSAIAQRPDQAIVPGWHSTASGHFATIFMSLPHLLSGVPSQVRIQLTSLKSFEAIMPALTAVAEQDSSPEQTFTHKRPASRTQCRASCRRCVAGPLSPASVWQSQLQREEKCEHGADMSHLIRGSEKFSLS